MSRFQLCINLLLLCLFFLFAPCIYTYRLTGHCKPHKQPQLLQAQQQHTRLFLRVDEEDDFGLGSDDDFDDEFNERVAEKSRARFSSNSNDNNKRKGGSKGKGGSENRNRPQRAIFSGLRNREGLTRAVAAGLFIGGIGAGIAIDSAINTNPKDLASRDAIDRNAPNPKICSAMGSSAMVLDQRVFITFNPFNIYVTQADTKPGCVLRQSNVVNLLQKERQLVSDEEMELCKISYNTWAYVGDINNKPQLNCVYQSDDAQNEFLSNPKIGLGEDVYDDDVAAAQMKPDTMGKNIKNSRKSLKEMNDEMQKRIQREQQQKK